MDVKSSSIFKYANMLVIASINLKGVENHFQDCYNNKKVVHILENKTLCYISWKALNTWSSIWSEGLNLNYIIKKKCYWSGVCLFVEYIAMTNSSRSQDFLKKKWWTDEKPPITCSPNAVVWHSVKKQTKWKMHSQGFVWAVSSCLYFVSFVSSPWLPLFLALIIPFGFKFTLPSLSFYYLWF